MSQTLPIVQKFLDYLVDERHFSPYTSRCYGLDLRQYGEFIAEEKGFDVKVDVEAAAASACESGAPVDEQTVTSVMLKADADTIRNFLSWMSERDYSSATMARNETADQAQSARI